MKNHINATLHIRSIQRLIICISSFSDSLIYCICLKISPTFELIEPKGISNIKYLFVLGFYSMVLKFKNTVIIVLHIIQQN